MGKSRDRDRVVNGTWVKAGDLSITECIDQLVAIRKKHGELLISTQVDHIQASASRIEVDTLMGEITIASRLPDG